MVRLITRADDAGVTPGTNEAIHAAATRGIIRNIGFMMPVPHVDAAADLMRDLGDAFCLGVHATVTSEWADLRWGPVLPAEQVPSLVEADGTFVRDTKTLHERANHDEIIAEVRAQITKARSLRIPIRYLDTHMVFNWLPGMQDRLDALGREEGLVVDAPMSRTPGLPSAGAASGSLAADFFHRVEAALSTEGGAFPVVFHPSRLDADSRRMIRQAGEDRDAVGRARAAETDFLTDPSTREWLEARHVRIVRYTDVFSAEARGSAG
jgi:predicted glycoside hydrolase/deacetylase ChbG (UPF0249 family)